MQRWLEVTTGYIAACQARGMGEERRKATRRELERLGNWLLTSRATMTLDVPARIVVIDLAELRLYGFRAQIVPIPELLRKLEKGCTKLLVR